MAQRRLLEGLGVTVAEETAYRALLRHGPTTLSELAAETGSSAAAIRRMLPRLEDLGLISRVAGRPLRLIATPPTIAIDILVARRQEELTHSRAAAALLATEVATRSGPQPEEVLEVVSGHDAVARRYLQLERNATREMLVLVHPPYAVDISDDRENQQRAARRGAPVTRGIYSPQAFEHPGMLTHTRRAIADGEQARLGQVPVKLAIADARTAILPLVSDEDRAVESALVVHPSALLDALVGLFETLWRAAVPLRLATAGLEREEETPDAEVLALLAAGMKDDAIARQLGLSPRTVQRRVQVLSERLGARTRFHAGFLAAQNDLLPK
ncbi:winged helix-turn-helix transcriptional regulator [Nonomuraea turkmeniaca]|uniref:Winged helix-turn-helix transcriptional regulator n=1 Tax=Nonomuraea turkmeniaca TaxID=103838 RepID=A0A5S4F5W6_9ACTN|nr:LuxR family transcriptional regulator [Nonomuraea turkmeniaca]TMR11344.1 winged helix-turn-helix transcriptional regulator [Nonomuraea turkmeniaca]